MLKKIFFPFFLFTFFYSNISFAQTSLPSFFDDNMVLQQNEDVSIWGTDDPDVTISVKGSWGSRSSVISDKNGKWKLQLKTPPAGGPYTLRIEGSDKIILSNILIGEVWICSGQSNMEMPVKGYTNQPVTGSNEQILNSSNDQIRLFTVKRNSSLTPMEDVDGEWLMAEPESVGDFSAVAYFFGKKINDVLGIPVGLIHTSWGGSSAEAWMNEESLSGFSSIEIPNEIPERRVNQTATLLYNAMLHPLTGYGIKGVIWYQGESNRLRANEYKSLFPGLINLWREKWNQGDFPFYFVQIAPYGYSEEQPAAAFLREAQLTTMQKVENTGMVVTMDIGNCNNIHPEEKKPVGERLAYWALSKDYNISGIAYSGPIYKEMSIEEDGKIKLSFDHAPNGFYNTDKGQNTFEIAGKDKVFHPAQIQIHYDKTITVWSDEVKKPVAVRYAFKNCIDGSLFNTEGLPASPFRTDDWDQ